MQVRGGRGAFTVTVAIGSHARSAATIGVLAEGMQQRLARVLMEGARVLSRPVLLDLGEGRREAASGRLAHHTPDVRLDGLVALRAGAHGEE